MTVSLRFSHNDWNTLKALSTSAACVSSLLLLCSSVESTVNVSLPPTDTSLWLLQAGRDQQLFEFYFASPASSSFIFIYLFFLFQGKFLVKRFLSLPSFFEGYWIKTRNNNIHNKMMNSLIKEITVLKYSWLVVFGSRIRLSMQIFTVTL